MINAGLSGSLEIGSGGGGGQASAALEAPWPAFRFQLEFSRVRLPDAPDRGQGDDQPLVCQGAFSEVSGLEASHEPKLIREGGRAWGGHQRAGNVSFATVVLKRGMTRSRDLWTWFFSTLHGEQGPAWGERLDVVIELQGADGQPRLRWKLARALPIKFKAADLHAAGTELAIEELHLVHEGLSAELPT